MHTILMKIMTWIGFLIFLICLLNASPLLAEVTDEDYIQYQMEVQTNMFQNAQDPETMQVEMKRIEAKHQPYSPEFRQYIQQLHTSPEKAMELSIEVKDRLQKKGIGWGNIRN